MQAFFESAFDIVYLSLVIALGITMLVKSAGRRQFALFGAMAVTLGCGDAFHASSRCVPRGLKAMWPFWASAK